MDITHTSDDVPWRLPAKTGYPTQALWVDVPWVKYLAQRMPREERLLLRAAVTRLSSEERLVLEELYGVCGAASTRRAVAARLGKTTNQVDYLHAQALHHLREILGVDLVDSAPARTEKGNRRYGRADSKSRSGAAQPTTGTAAHGAAPHARCRVEVDGG